MALKALLFILASFLLVIARATSSKVHPLAPAKSPVKAPTPAPSVKAPVAPPPAPALKAPVLPLNPPARTKLDCDAQCDKRCKLHSRKNVCKRACMTCCDRCKCVPPGTYGNQEMCGKCYTDMKTHGNRFKCP